MTVKMVVPTRGKRLLIEGVLKLVLMIFISIKCGAGFDKCLSQIFDTWLGIVQVHGPAKMANQLKVRQIIGFGRLVVATVDNPILCCAVLEPFKTTERKVGSLVLFTKQNRTTHCSNAPFTSVRNVESKPSKTFAMD
jgi:hypothetical protein